MKSAKVSFDQFVNLTVLEKFKRKVLYPVTVHITGKEETDLMQAAKIADVFSLINRPVQNEKGSSCAVRSNAGSPLNPDRLVEQRQTNERANTLICRICKKGELAVKDCPSSRRRVANGTSNTFTKPVAANTVSSGISSAVLFKPFRSTGMIYLGPSTPGCPTKSSGMRRLHSL